MPYINYNMNLDQAYQILDYGAIPKKREEQICLIKLVGYTSLRGGRNLSACHDRQLYRVAGRLFREAERKVQVELQARLREMREEEHLTQYHTFLCDRFNLPESEQDNYTISELEEQLMQ